MRYVKEFTIERARWAYGTYSSESRLYSQIDKKMCCLGFFGRALGAKVREINGKLSPQDAPNVPWPDWILHLGDLGDCDSLDTCELMSANDTIGVSNKERERRIKKQFAEHGVKVKFTGRYPIG